MNDRIFKIEPYSPMVKKNLRQIKKLDPNIIRVGDNVMVANPLTFLRCGYPLSKDAMREEINMYFGKVINDLIYSVKSGDTLIEEKADDNLFITPQGYRGEDKKRKAIIDALVSYRLFARKFGGSNRDIYTKLRPELQGKKFRVTRIKFVTTGTYYPSSGGIGFYDDDYDPPCLGYSKIHKILSLEKNEDYTYQEKMKLISPSSNYSQNCHKNPYEEIRIEAIHVEKMPDDRAFIQDKDGNFIKNPHFGLPKSTRIFKASKEIIS